MFYEFVLKFAIFMCFRVDCVNRVIFTFNTSIYMRMREVLTNQAKNA